MANATDGSVQALSSDGSNIAAGILAGLGNLPATVAMASNCAFPIGTTFDPATQGITSGDNTNFKEWISVNNEAEGGTYTCEDWATVNGQPLVDENGEGIYEHKTIHVPGIDAEPKTETNELGFDLNHTVEAIVSAGDYGPVQNVLVEFEVVSGPNSGENGVDMTDESGLAEFTYTPPLSPAGLGTDSITACFHEGLYGCVTVEKTWVDTTPPVAYCEPGVNPAGHEPNAPGKGEKGQNQDGFYHMSGEDVVWPSDSLAFYVVDLAHPDDPFGPFSIDDDFKYVQAPGGPLKIKEGSGEVEWKITGNGAAAIVVVDGSGNESDPAMCFVPPPPMAAADWNGGESVHLTYFAAISSD